MPDLTEQNITLYAISYDPVETLAGFAEQHGITYPLLSDVGSRVIRQLGLLNEHVFEQHAAYGIEPKEHHQGVPYPGVFVLDESGTVVDKRFHQSYRERETGIAVLESALGIIAREHGAETIVTGESVQIRAYLDEPTYAYFQQHRLTVELTVDPGLHVYAEPVPEGFVPLRVEIEPIEGLIVGEATWPAPHRYVFEGLDDEFWVHAGTVRGSVPLTFTVPIGTGDLEIKGQVSFQVCADYYCLPAAEAGFALPIAEVGLVGRPVRRD